MRPGARIRSISKRRPQHWASTLVNWLTRLYSTIVGATRSPQSIHSPHRVTRLHALPPRHRFTTGQATAAARKGQRAAQIS